MATTLQSFLATQTQKACASLIEAVERIPEDKRGWSPMGKARTALNQAAECALLNGSSVKLLIDGKWPDTYDFNDYYRELAELEAKGWSEIKALLEENTAKAVEKIGTLSQQELDGNIDMPWGPMTGAQIAGYPYWNMSYHEGQINYLASMLGCLD